MPDPRLVSRAQRAATLLERAWERWRTTQGLEAEPLPPVSSYVGYSIEEPWGRPRVVFGVDAEDAERLAALLQTSIGFAVEGGTPGSADPGYRAPTIDWDRTAQRVLTLERVDGIPIGDRDAIVAAGHDPDLVMKKAAEAFFYQVFRDGFFHADMHGGNAFVDREGRIVPVDFGIMGRVDEDTRGYLAELLVAFLRRDYRAVAEVQFRAGYVPADQSIEMFAQACRSIGEPIFGKPSQDISIARLLAHLLRVTEQFEMAVQPQLLLLQKTMLMAEGMGTRLNPNVNIWELARPLIEDWMRDHFGPRATVQRSVTDLMQGLRRVPRLIDSLHVIAERERQQFERAEAEAESVLTRWTRDIGFAEIIAVLALIAAIVAWLR